MSTAAGMNGANLVVFALVLAKTLATVNIHLKNREAVVCEGTTMLVECTTTTASGFLLWRNGSGSTFSFANGSAHVGDNGILGSMTVTLDSIETVDTAVVYTSTAEDFIISETTFSCVDGDTPEIITVYVKSPTSPSWAHSACKFSQDSVQLSWNPPVVAPECCVNYTVQLSTNQALTISISSNTSLNITLPIEEQPVTATVYCIDHIGDNTTSQVMTIDNSITLEVTIEVLNISCVANTYYNISWTTSPPSAEDVCTPSITNSTITCSTLSTHQSNNNTRSMICSVPAGEIIVANVTVTNEAGITSTKSTSTDALAQICQRLIASTSGVGAAAGFLLIISVVMLAVSCIAFCVFGRRRNSYSPNNPTVTRSATDPTVTPRSATDPTDPTVTPRSATDPTDPTVTPRSATDPTVTRSNTF